MAEADDPIGERVLARLPGWLFLIAGLAMIGAVVLTPTWLAADALAGRHALMAAQREAMLEHRERYQHFYTALKRGDPLLLERLAYEQLRLKPRDARPAFPRRADDPGQAIPGGGEGRAGFRAGPSMIPVTDWLARPLPQAGSDATIERPRQSMLTRIATGGSRWVLLAAGLLCVAGGLLAGGSSEDSVLSETSRARK